MTTNAPPEPTGGAFLSAQHVITHGDAAIINRRDRQQGAVPPWQTMTIPGLAGLGSYGIRTYAVVQVRQNGGLPS